MIAEILGVAIVTLALRALNKAFEISRISFGPLSKMQYLSEFGDFCAQRWPELGHP